MTNTSSLIRIERWHSALQEVRQNEGGSMDKLSAFLYLLNQNGRILAFKVQVQCFKQIDNFVYFRETSTIVQNKLTRTIFNTCYILLGTVMLVIRNGVCVYVTQEKYL